MPLDVRQHLRHVLRPDTIRPVELGPETVRHRKDTSPNRARKPLVLIGLGADQPLMRLSETNVPKKALPREPGVHRRGHIAKKREERVRKPREEVDTEDPKTPVKPRVTDQDPEGDPAEVPGRGPRLREEDEEDDDVHHHRKVQPPQEQPVEEADHPVGSNEPREPPGSTDEKRPRSQLPLMPTDTAANDVEKKVENRETRENRESPDQNPADDNTHRPDVSVHPLVHLEDQERHNCGDRGEKPRSVLSQTPEKLEHIYLLQ